MWPPEASEPCAGRSFLLADESCPLVEAPQCVCLWAFWWFLPWGYCWESCGQSVCARLWGRCAPQGLPRRGLRSPALLRPLACAKVLLRLLSPRGNLPRLLFCGVTTEVLQAGPHGGECLALESCWRVSGAPTCHAFLLLLLSEVALSGALLLYILFGEGSSFFSVLPGLLWSDPPSSHM